MHAVDAAARLEVETSRFLALHEAAYGTGLVKPKHHWLLDVPSQLRRGGILLDAFVIERQHLLVKSVTEHIRNTSDYETSACCSVLTLQLQHRDDEQLFDGLIGRTARMADHPRARVANTLTVGCLAIGVGEFVFRSHAAAVVVACALEDNTLFVLVALAMKVADVTPHGIRVRGADKLAVWPAAEVQHCLAWRPDADGTTILLRM